MKNVRLLQLDSVQKVQMESHRQNPNVNLNWKGQNSEKPQSEPKSYCCQGQTFGKQERDCSSICFCGNFGANQMRRRLQRLINGVQREVRSGREGFRKFHIIFCCPKKYGRVIGAMNGREGNFIFLLLVKNVRYKTSSDTSKSESENLENPIQKISSLHKRFPEAGQTFHKNSV